MHWPVPPEWAGETVFIIGGGPSVAALDVELLRGSRVIAINNSWKLCPWADVLYFCDAKWWDWHGAQVERHFEGRYIVTPSRTLPDQRGRLIKLTGDQGLEADPCGLKHGSNSGYQAIGLAYHFGAIRIVLIGYDMRVVGGRTHYHEGHPTTREKSYGQTLMDAMLPKFPSIVEPLKAAGVEVVNATPGSALRCWPIVELAEILEPVHV